MRGRIKRPFTVVTTVTLALLLTAPAGGALAKGPGGGAGTGGGGSGSGGGTGGGGTGGGGTGGGGGGTTSKGTTLGDLNMVLRNDQGLPILNSNNCLQPISYDSSVGALATAEHMYDYVVKVYLIPLMGTADPTAPCDIQAASADAVVPVDFGRLSVGRSPESVLAKQLADVKTLLGEDDPPLTLDASGRIVVNGAAIDSPLQNLAIYQSLLETRLLTGARLGDFAPLTFWELAAAAFAAAADKTAAQTIDTVQYMNRILNIPTTATWDEPLKVTSSKGTEEFLNYGGFAGYNRAEMFPGHITYNVLYPDGTWKPETGSILELVFKQSEEDANVDRTNANAFASMVDDCRQVLRWVHDADNLVIVDPIFTS